MRKYFRFKAAFTIFIIGIATSLFVYYFEESIEYRDNIDHLEKHILNRKNFIEKEIRTNLDMLQLFYRDWNYSGDEFHKIAVQVLKSYEDVDAIAWLPKIGGHCKSDMKHKVIDNGCFDFSDQRIWEFHWVATSRPTDDGAGIGDAVGVTVGARVVGVPVVGVIVGAGVVGTTVGASVYSTATSSIAMSL